MEHVGTDATKVLKVNPAPDGVETIHTSEAGEKCKVANNARCFVNLWNSKETILDRRERIVEEHVTTTSNSYNKSFFHARTTI